MYLSWARTHMSTYAPVFDFDHVLFLNRCVHRQKHCPLWLCIGAQGQTYIGIYTYT